MGLVRVMLIWVFLWQMLMPLGVPAAQGSIHVPSRCSCASVERGCCGGEGSVQRCCERDEVCNCGCMVPAEQRTPRQDPRAINTADWTGVLPEPLPLRMVTEDVQGRGVGMGETASAHLHDGRRRHSACCIWRE